MIVSIEAQRFNLRLHLGLLKAFFRKIFRSNLTVIKSKLNTNRNGKVNRIFVSLGDPDWAFTSTSPSQWQSGIVNIPARVMNRLKNTRDWHIPSSNSNGFVRTIYIQEIILYKRFPSFQDETIDFKHITVLAVSYSFNILPMVSMKLSTSAQSK